MYNSQTLQAAKRPAAFVVVGQGGRAGHSCDEISRPFIKAGLCPGWFIFVCPRNYLLQNSPVRGYRQGIMVLTMDSVLPAGLNFETMPVSFTYSPS